MLLLRPVVSVRDGTCVTKPIPTAVGAAQLYVSGIPIIKEELEDQSLEGFTDIFWIISDFGFLEPKSLSTTRMGDKQRLHRSVDCMGGAIVYFPITQCSD